MTTTEINPTKRSITPTPEELGITPEQHQNFVTVRDYLRKMDPEGFDMTSWCKCVVGTASKALGRPIEHYESWNAYTKDVFGITTTGEPDSAFMFLFGATWKGLDNTPRGAADRIDAFLRGECLV